MNNWHWIVFHCGINNELFQIEEGTGHGQADSIDNAKKYALNWINGRKYQYLLIEDFNSGQCFHWNNSIDGWFEIEKKSYSKLYYKINYNLTNPDGLFYCSICNKFYKAADMAILHEGDSAGTCFICDYGYEDE